jgi:3-dehydroquinate synthase
MAAIVRVEGPPAHEVRIGAGVLDLAAELAARHSGALVLTDETVAGLHLERLGALAGAPVVRLAPGEGAKSMAILERVLDAMCDAELDRDACLVALGGGVVGDLGGLAAALYKRGVAVLQCPTTLLAQVDASVGGKTAVNLAAGKNLAGVFHAPVGVLADSAVLATLPEAELRSGLGEVLKSALLAGEADLAALEAEAEALVARDPEALEACVTRCVRLKVRVVAEDPREAGPRRRLNLGHTFGHAIERAAGYGVVPHGVAVAVGISLALEESRERGLLEDADLPARVRALGRRLGLPADLDELREGWGATLEEDELRAAMRHDKKNRGGEVRLVLPVRPGEVRLDVSLRA